MFENAYNYQRRDRDRTYYINLDLPTKRYLCGYMEQELHYYNVLITEFNSKLRVLYSEIESIKDQMERLWLTVAQTGTDIRSLVSVEVNKWPEIFRPFKGLITDGKKLLINERMMILFDIAATKAIIHPTVRKSMAYEVLHWVQPQAKQLAESDNNSSGQMRTPIQMLQPTDIARKRHLQIPNDLIKFTYVPETSSTLIKIPYSNSNLVVEGHDLTKESHDYIIIRQKPGIIPNSATSWQITIKEGTKYLLNLIDMAHTRRKNSK